MLNLRLRIFRVKVIMAFSYSIEGSFLQSNSYVIPIMYRFKFLLIDYIVL